MISGENLFQNLLTLTILLVMALIVYLKMSGKTFPDAIRDFREADSDKHEEVYDSVQGGFEDIR